MAAAALEIIIYLPSQSLRTTHSGRAIFHQNASQHAISMNICSYNLTTVYVLPRTYTLTHHQSKITVRVSNWMHIVWYQHKICRNGVPVRVEKFKICTHAWGNTQDRDAWKKHAIPPATYYNYSSLFVRVLDLCYVQFEFLHQLADGGSKGWVGICSRL